MRRWAAVLLLCAGCSNAPLAGFLDTVRPSRARPDIDLFLNSGPNNLHAEPCIAAAKAGKHIFVEKPLARTADEAHTLWKGVAASGVKHMCAFMHRFIPALRLARTMIHDGELGEIRHYRSTFLLNMADPAGPPSWRYDAALAGGGATGDLGSHHIDLLVAPLGRFLGNAVGGGRTHGKQMTS